MFIVSNTSSFCSSLFASWFIVSLIEFNLMHTIGHDQKRGLPRIELDTSRYCPTELTTRPSVHLRTFEKVWHPILRKKINQVGTLCEKFSGHLALSVKHFLMLRFSPVSLKRLSENRSSSGSTPFVYP